MTTTIEIPAELLGLDADFGARRLFVADWLETHPERHDQTWWIYSGLFDAAENDDREGVVALTDLRENSCGTTGCVAGWTVIFFGDPSWMIDGQVVVQMGATRRTIDEVAKMLLDLNQPETNLIFGGSRTREEVIAALRAV